jgi:hypothetical protein
VRAAIRTALAELTPADRAERFERDIALLAVPELWSANLGVLRTALDGLGALVARRAGCDPHDVAVRALTGAVLGITVQVFLDAAAHPGADSAAALDEALAVLEVGFPW